MSIDEKRLDELMESTSFMVFDLKVKSEQTEIIRLARLGLWAEKHAIPAIKPVVEWNRTLKDYQGALLNHGLEKACGNWDLAANVEVVDFKPLMDALAALPKDANLK